MNYRKMYGFEVIGAMLNHKTVYMLDKYDKTVTCMNTLNMANIANIISDAAENEQRYYFWEEQE